MTTKALWLVMISRIVLGTIFASAAVSYFWSVAFGWMLLPVPTTVQAMQFAGVIIELMLLRAYAGHYAGMFMNDTWSLQESTP
jgi:hypothetical protein